MIKYSIVLVAFPFDDFSSTKVRPALCLTNELGPYNHVVVAFISSKVESYHLSSDILLEVQETWFPETGLKEQSLIRLHRLVTLPIGLVKRKLGNLPAPICKIVFNKLIDLFKP